MPTNFYMFFVSALIPLVIGAIWYNPKVFGNSWMKVNNFTPEYAASGNMAVIFGLTYVLSVMMSFFLSSVVIHQGAVFSMMFPEIQDAGSAAQTEFNDIMSRWGNRGRTFGHGAVHGTMLSVFVVLPLTAIIALFERRGAKYIFIHFGYWLICLILMGGLICSTLKYAPL